MAFNGNDLVVAISTTSGSELKFATSQTCGISFSNALIGATSKDSLSWEESISGLKSWSLSTDGLANFDDVASSTAVEQFSDFAIAGTQVFIQFARTVQTDGTALTTGDFEGWSGQAFIESFDISGTHNDVVTYSVSLKGTGALTKVVTA